MLSKAPNPERVLRYAKLRFTNPTMPKRQCGRLAGYREQDLKNLDKVERSKIYKDMRQATIDAAMTAGVNPQSVMETLKRSMDRSLVSIAHDSTANQAAKIAGDYLGMAAPVQVHSEVTVKHSILMGILGQVNVD